MDEFELTANQDSMDMMDILSTGLNPRNHPCRGNPGRYCGEPWQAGDRLMHFLNISFDNSLSMNGVGRHSIPVELALAQPRRKRRYTAEFGEIGASHD